MRPPIKNRMSFNDWLKWIADTGCCPHADFTIDAIKTSGLCLFAKCKHEDYGGPCCVRDCPAIDWKSVNTIKEE